MIAFIVFVSVAMALIIAYAVKSIKECIEMEKKFNEEFPDFDDMYSRYLTRKRNK